MRIWGYEDMRIWGYEDKGKYMESSKRKDECTDKLQTALSKTSITIRTWTNIKFCQFKMINSSKTRLAWSQRKHSSRQLSPSTWAQTAKPWVFHLLYNLDHSCSYFLFILTHKLIWFKAFDLDLLGFFLFVHVIFLNICLVCVCFQFWHLLVWCLSSFLALTDAIYVMMYHYPDTQGIQPEGTIWLFMPSHIVIIKIVSVTIIADFTRTILVSPVWLASLVWPVLYQL